MRLPEYHVLGCNFYPVLKIIHFDPKLQLISLTYSPHKTQVIMIIKGLFRRYQKWNPVHPTSGAFWGMGVGIGCGVGWGPGFGPEVVGYVGAGCGVGFSVGITFAGFGIGLPAKVLIEGPYKVVAATSNHTWDLVRSSNFLTIKNDSGDELGGNMPFFPSQICNLHQKANERLSYLRDLDLLKKGTEIFNLERPSSLCTKSISESCTSLRNRFSDKDDKE